MSFSFSQPSSSLSEDDFFVVNNQNDNNNQNRQPQQRGFFSWLKSSSQYPAQKLPNLPQNQPLPQPTQTQRLSLPQNYAQQSYSQQNHSQQNYLQSSAQYYSTSQSQHSSTPPSQPYVQSPPQHYSSSQYQPQISYSSQSNQQVHYYPQNSKVPSQSYEPKIKDYSPSAPPSYNPTNTNQSTAPLNSNTPSSYNPLNNVNQSTSSLNSSAPPSYSPANIMNQQNSSFFNPYALPSSTQPYQYYYSPQNQYSQNKSQQTNIKQINISQQNNISQNISQQNNISQNISQQNNISQNISQQNNILQQQAYYKPYTPSQGYIIDKYNNSQKKNIQDQKKHSRKEEIKALKKSVDELQPNSKNQTEKIVENNSNLSCPICGLKFVIQNDYAISLHIESCLNQEKKPVSQNIPKPIPKEENDPFAIKCPYNHCYSTIQTYEFYDHTMKYHPSAQDQKYPCPICTLSTGIEYKVKDNTNLIEHLKGFHQDLKGASVNISQEKSQNNYQKREKDSFDFDPELIFVLQESQKEFEEMKKGNSQDQIQKKNVRKSKVITYMKEGKKCDYLVEEIQILKESQECPICFEDFQIGDERARLECFCVFHPTCISEWFQRSNGRCPVHSDN